MRIEPLGGHVIEEKKGFRAEDGDVVDAMIDQVFADGVVAVHEHGHLDLGADAIDAGDENGIAHLGKFGAEEAAKAADLAEDFRAMGALEKSRQAGLDLVSKVNINSGAGVGFQAITHGFLSI